MNEVQQNIIDLISIELGTKKDFYNINIYNWELLFKTAREQGIATLLYPSIDRIRQEMKLQNDTLNEWEKLVHQSTYNRILYSQNVYQILNEFNKENVQLVILKGLVIIMLPGSETLVGKK